MKMTNKTPRLFLSVLYLLTAAACSPPPVSEVEISITGKLVFAEDIRNRSGLGAGRFGDLVMIDSETQKRYILTDDRFYYAHPNLVNNGTELWFESKRGTNLATAGLGTPSDLYRMDLQTKLVSSLRDTLSERIGEEMGRTVRGLAVSAGDDKLFVQRTGIQAPSGSGMYVLDLASGKAKQATSNSNFDQTPMGNAYWSPDAYKVAYDASESHLGRRRLAVYDKQKDSVFVVTNPVSEYNSRNSYKAGSWVDDKSFVYSYRIRDLNKILFFLYEHNTGESTQLGVLTREGFTVDSINMSSDQETVVFIGHTFNEKFERLHSELYEFHLINETLSQLTETGGHKGWLRWYEEL